MSHIIVYLGIPSGRIRGEFDLEHIEPIVDSIMEKYVEETADPESVKCDWYVVGGRWEGVMAARKGEKGVLPAENGRFAYELFNGYDAIVNEGRQGPYILDGVEYIPVNGGLKKNIVWDAVSRFNEFRSYTMLRLADGGDPRICDELSKDYEFRDDGVYFSKGGNVALLFRKGESFDQWAARLKRDMGRALLPPDAFIDTGGNWHDENDAWETILGDFMAGQAGERGENPLQAARDAFLAAFERFMDEELKDDDGFVVLDCHCSPFYMTSGPDGAPEDEPSQAEEWEEDAEAGDLYSMQRLAMAYLNGEDVPADPEKAAYWFKKAADAGDARAMFNMGLFCAKGYGMERDFSEAARWMERAAQAGDGDAPSLAEEYRRMARNLPKAENGDRDAQAELAGGYMKLGNSLVQMGPADDYAQCLMWAERAAAQGSAEAMWILGLAWERGRGVAEDAAKAASFYRQGAELGHAACQHSLGIFYVTGKVFGKDGSKAFELFRRSAEQGNALAMKDLGRCYQFAIGCMGNMKTALEWYRRASGLLDDPELARRVRIFEDLAEKDPHFGDDYPQSEDDTDHEAIVEGLRQALAQDMDAMARQRESEDAHHADQWLKANADLIADRPTVVIRGRKFVFTGVTSEEKWPEIRSRFLAQGGVERTAVSGQTDYIVCEPRWAGQSKLDKLRELRAKGSCAGTQVVLADDFYRALGYDPHGKSTAGPADPDREPQAAEMPSGPAQPEQGAGAPAGPRTSIGGYFTIAGTPGLVIALNRKDAYQAGDRLATLFDTTCGRQMEMGLFGGIDNGLNITFTREVSLTEEGLRSIFDDNQGKKRFLRRVPGLLVMIEEVVAEGRRVTTYIIITRRGIFSAFGEDVSPAEQASYERILANALPEGTDQAAPGGTEEAAPGGTDPRDRMAEMRRRLDESRKRREEEQARKQAEAEERQRTARERYRVERDEWEQACQAVRTQREERLSREIAEARESMAADIERRHDEAVRAAKAEKERHEGRRREAEAALGQLGLFRMGAKREQRRSIESARLGLESSRLALIRAEEDYRREKGALDQAVAARQARLKARIEAELPLPEAPKDPDAPIKSAPTRTQRENALEMDQICEAIRMNGGPMRTGDIAMAVGISGQKASALLSVLTREGRVVKLEGAKRVTVFDLAPDR